MLNGDDDDIDDDWSVLCIRCILLLLLIVSPCICISIQLLTFLDGIMAACPVFFVKEPWQTTGEKVVSL